MVYVGDRVKRGELNGKSANLNHAILTKIYPHTRRASDVPEKDVLMIMDCDHMVKPEIFLKMVACMRDPRVGVTLVPQVRFAPLLVWCRKCAVPLACEVHGQKMTLVPQVRCAPCLRGARTNDRRTLARASASPSGRTCANQIPSRRHVPVRRQVTLRVCRHHACGVV